MRERIVALRVEVRAAREQARRQGSALSILVLRMLEEMLTLALESEVL